jgi:hypothetical protein
MSVRLDHDFRDKQLPPCMARYGGCCSSNHAPPCLVLSCLRLAVAGRTFPAGERGSAAGSLLSSHDPNYTWACVLCRPSPEFPFRFIWVLGWSTWHLALDPSSVLLAAQWACCPGPCLGLRWCFLRKARVDQRAGGAFATDGTS